MAKIKSVEEIELFEKGLSAYTREEARDKIVGVMSFFPQYWAKSKIKEPQLADRISGFGHSLFSSLDGSGLNIPSMLVAPRGEIPSREPGCELELFARLAKELGFGQEEMDRAVGFADIGAWAPWDESEERSKDKLMAPAKIASLRWEAYAKERGQPDQRAIEGYSLSLAALLEGVVGQGYFLAPFPSPEDKPYHMANGERWYEELPEGDPALEADLGGGLRYAWSRRWAEPAREADCAALIASIKEGKELSREIGPARPAKFRPRV